MRVDQTRVANLTWTLVDEKGEIKEKGEVNGGANSVCKNGVLSV